MDSHGQGRTCLEENAAGQEVQESDAPPTGNSDPVMTLEGIACYLKVSEKTIFRMVQAGELPGLKVSNQWRFLRTAVNDWMAVRMRRAAGGNAPDETRAKNNLPPLPQLISPNRIVTGLQPGAKESILNQLVTPIVNEGVVAKPARYFAALTDRERIVSTAIDEGVAVPHARSPERSGLQENCIVLGICPRGTDFDSLDEMPTHLFFLIGSISTEAHLRLMAKTMLMLRIPGFKTALTAACDKNEIRRLLMKAYEEMSSRLQGSLPTNISGA